MKKNLDRALQETAKYIKSLDYKEEFPRCETLGKFASREDEGFINITGKDLLGYRKILAKLNQSVDNEYLSQKAIDSYLLDAIFYSLDMNQNRKEISFKKRLSQAIRNLKEKMLQEPIKYRIYYPLFGASNSGLPTRIGNISFEIFSEEHKKLFLEGVNKIRDEDQKVWFSNYVNSGQIIDNFTACVEILAIDKEAANYSALKEINFTKNIINFFVELIPYNHGFLYLPGENERLVINVPMIVSWDKPKYTFGSTVVGPLAQFSFKDLFDALKKNNIDINRINELLLKKNTTHFEKRLLSSISWAGKAVGLHKNNKELAFLFYAISLETLIIPQSDRESITKKLKARISKLLANEKNYSKAAVEKKVAALYDIRSKIVHDGEYEVSEGDLALIKFFARNCIGAFLCDVDLISIKTTEQFQEWFDKDER